MNREQQDKIKEFLTQANALLDSMNTSIRSDPDNIWKYAGYKQYIRKYNQLVHIIGQTITLTAVIDLYDFDRIPGIGDTVITQQKELFESVHANLSILVAYLGNKLNLKVDEIANLGTFLQANLRRAIFRTPESERDVQDVIEQLLIGRGFAKGLDYDRETGRVKVSIKEFVPDFIFPRLALALEVKLSKDKQKSKDIVDEINADIVAYSKNYPFIIFLVYDLGSIRDEAEFRRDLEAEEGVSVIVVKH